MDPIHQVLLEIFPTEVAEVIIFHYYDAMIPEWQKERNKKWKEVKNQLKQITSPIKCFLNKNHIDQRIYITKGPARHHLTIAKYRFYKTRRGHRRVKIVLIVADLAPCVLEDWKVKEFELFKADRIKRMEELSVIIRTKDEALNLLLEERNGIFDLIPIMRQEIDDKRSTMWSRGLGTSFAHRPLSLRLVFDANTI